VHVSRHRFHGDPTRFEVIARFVADRFPDARYAADVAGGQYAASMADFYDVIVGLHPDEALRAVVDSARVRPVLVVPCCNFWARDQRLGQADLLAAIRRHHCGLDGGVEDFQLDFRGPKNRGMVLTPPAQPPRT
jgi:hypothetical protein